LIRISVIIPAFNASETISRTIESLLVQKYKHWEAIIVDDGSLDNTVPIVKEFSKIDSRISLISQINQGVSVARNAGIALSCYEWMLFLDADDWISTNYFDKVNQAAMDFPEVDVFHGRWVRVASNGTLLKERNAPDYPDLFPPLAASCIFAIHSCVFKKALLNASGVFDISMTTCEDWDLWQRIARTGARFKFLDEIIAFYSLRVGSLSKNVEQCYKDTLRVLNQGHAKDPRVLKPDQEYLNGLASGNLCIARTHYEIWFLGCLIAEGKDFKSRLAGIDFQLFTYVEPNDVADILYEVCLLPSNQPLSYWPELWQQIGKDLKDLLSILESLTQKKGLAKNSILSLKRLMIQNSKTLDAISNEPFFVKKIDIVGPIADIKNLGELERLFCLLECEGEPLGSIELPIWNQQVPAWQIKSSIAKKYHWKILGLFYKKHIYREGANGKLENGPLDFEQTHNQIGWKCFLQDIWGRPGWSLDQFYKPHAYSRPLSKTIEIDSGTGIEISMDLQNSRIFCDKPELPITVGGILIGTVKLPETNYLNAQHLRTCINTGLGLHLCQISVQEALIGKPLDQPNTLRQRLTNLSGIKDLDSDWKICQGNFQTSIVIGDNCVYHKNRIGFEGTSRIERVAIPRGLLGEINRMSDSFEKLERIDMNEQSQNLTKDPGKIHEENVIASFYNRQHFESLFSSEPDPWKYTHPYEQTKYEQTLSLLPNDRIDCAMEIACAEGHFTQQLAPKVQKLLAVDISQIALERAAQRCSSFQHIVFERLDFFKDPVKRKFDLIVCSEMLYFVGDKKNLKNIASKISAALNPDGYLLTAHAHQVIDDPNKPGYEWGLPFGAKVIGDTLAKIPTLHLKKEIRTPLYRIQLFKKEKINLLSRLLGKKPYVQFLDQPTPVPMRVKSTVKWKGGNPTFSNDHFKINTKSLPILMYHRIASAGRESLSRFRVTPENFEAQLNYLKDGGYYSVSWKSWIQAILLKKSLPGRPIAITFDDGYLDFYQTAWPLLNKYGFSATVFLVEELIGKVNKWDLNFGEELPLMNWDQIQYLNKKGILFGSHSCSHTALTGLCPSQVFIEGIRSRAMLSKSLGYPVELFAFPYGDTDEVVTEVISSCGYVMGFTCRTGFSTIKDNPMLQPRIEVMGNDSLQDFIKKITI
jgi:glycosyltransferase involved in cell wall biosynthesis/peptidoglycan/xylan/chitin deacetylase (PgdA/CDA1 family)/2-polyprenyl-3-methyl-5-hydroxy-6-metoxy-1,4-benzoquinol methylase